MSTYNLAFYHAAAPKEPAQRAGLQTLVKIAATAMSCSMFTS